MDGSEKTVVQGLKTGEILHAPWGYNMTHPDFYLVLGGAEVGKFAKLVEIERLEQATGYLCGNAVPCEPHIHKGPVLKKKVKAGGAVKFESYKSGWLWDGKPKRFNYCD